MVVEWLVCASAVQFVLNNGVPVASSVPATEHSVMTSWATEKEAIDNMLDHFGSGLFSCVMDSYDYAQVSTTYKCHMQHCHFAETSSCRPAYTTSKPFT